MDGESSLETVWAGWREGGTLHLDTLTLRQTEVWSAGEAQPRDEDLGPVSPYVPAKEGAGGREDVMEKGQMVDAEQGDHHPHGPKKTKFGTQESQVSEGRTVVVSKPTERVGEGGWEVPTGLAQESWTLILKHGFR